MTSRKIESILIKTIQLLKKDHINYWITDGTLLGIIRDDKIIPWDTEIDIGLWRSEKSTVEIKKLFIENGYKYIESFADDHCLLFMIDDIYLDINLYSKNQKKVFIKWATYPKGFFNKQIIRVANFMFEIEKTNHNHKNQLLFKSILKKLIQIIIIFIPKTLKNLIFKYAKNKYIYIGCSYPLELLKFKQILFRGHELVVPIDSEEYLRLTYGDDWRIPNRNYDWKNDTFNLEFYKDNK